MIGRLETVPALDRPDLLADPVAAAIRALGLADVQVGEIDPGDADTAAFCERYGVGLDVSANCVVVAGRRGGETTLAACLVLASDRADVNGVVRRRLEARRASFAAMDVAVAESGMEYGGITAIGLPDGWPILVDERVDATDHVVIGSGLRRSKLVVPGRLLAQLPGAEVIAVAV
jgi:prolyl-tRNA editing enzyme YbaK/EbsC (Cys-tRNA(Pro) deacylase)